MFQDYVKLNTTRIRPYIKGEDLVGISVSEFEANFILKGES